MLGGGGFRGGGRFALMGGPAAGAPTDLVALDALQAVRVQTSTFAPEFGRTPGAQISMTSRSGSNSLHGSLFEYFGNNRLNANEWFANSAAQPRAPMRLNQFGGTLGGPVLKNRTFFFASYEGLRFLEPETTTAAVPDLNTRQQAAPALRPYIQAFPLPNGAPLAAGAAQFTTVYSNPSRRDSMSLRMDHTLTARHTMFVRYTYAPSRSEFRGEDMIAPNVLSERVSRPHGLTGSLISILAPQVTNDLRVNYTTSTSTSSSRMDTFGGAIPLTDRLLFPAGVTSSNGEFRLNVAGLSGYSYADQSRNEQRQLNLVDSVTVVAGTHQYKAGVDFRLVSPSLINKFYSQNVTFRGLSGDAGALLSGAATTSIVSASVPLVEPLLLNNSVFLQDTFRASAKTTVTYGIRWDVNPAPRVRSGPKPFALCDTALGQCALTQQLPLYDTRWTNLAPRIGVATALSEVPGSEVIFRAGIGVFHDLGYGSTTASFNGAPYVASRNLVLPVFPLASADLLPPALPPVPPYGQISAAERELESPAVYQLNMTLERSLGRSQTLGVSYVGTHGIRLLRTETGRAATNAYDMLRLATNGAVSDYNALQLQFRRRLARNLQAQLSYTYGHSIDTASNDMAMAAGFRSLYTNQRGNSDFDVRHSFHFSGSYGLPGPRATVLKYPFSDWWIDWFASARTALPFDVQGISAVPETLDPFTATATTRGLFAQVRPDYTGLPIWLNDPQAPGGQRLNRDAFAAPADFRQGGLGRNSIRGFPMYQIDFSLRRQVAIGEGLGLSIMAQAFNVLNHPNFANPSPNEGANMASPNFGVATRILNEASLGGSSSFFRTGGPRSLQLAIRLQF